MILVRIAKQIEFTEYLNTRSNSHAIHRLTNNIHAEHLQCVNNLFDIRFICFFDNVSAFVHLLFVNKRHERTHVDARDIQ